MEVADSQSEVKDWRVAEDEVKYVWRQLWSEDRRHARIERMRDVNMIGNKNKYDAKKL